MHTRVGAHITRERQIAAVVVLARIQVGNVAGRIDHTARVEVGSAHAHIDVLASGLDQTRVVQRTRTRRGDQLVVQTAEAHLACGQVVEHCAVVEHGDMAAVGLAEVKDPGIVEGDVVKIHIVVVAPGDGGRGPHRDRQRAAADHAGVNVAAGIDANAAVDGECLA